MAWGIADESDNTWMMCEFGRTGWTRNPERASPFGSKADAQTLLNMLVSSRHTPRIKPRELP